MKLRIASTVLWLLAGWAVGGACAAFLGVNPAIGPIVGFVWGAFVLVDPKHVLWGPREAREPDAQGAAAQGADS